MKVFRVNDIFYSLQGEGHNTGRAAVFIRFAGCNLRCPFCDTEFDEYREMTAEEVVETIPHHPTPISPLVVLTGGEPTLQVDEEFVDLLHQHGYEVAMESNGTRPAPKNLDWLTVSPKSLGDGRMVKSIGRLPDELKVIFDEETDPMLVLTDYLPQGISHFSFLISHLCFLQPCDTGDAERNAAIIQRCVEYIKAHPQWRLSLQTHKLVGFK